MILALAFELANRYLQGRCEPVGHADEDERGWLAVVSLCIQGKAHGTTAICSPSSGVASVNAEGRN